jgi:protein-tyrosine phosphatase
VDVVFPDGTVVRASSIGNRVEHDPTRSFGLYLDMRWLPTWPAEVVEWQDYGLPADSERAADQITAAFARARRGDMVEVGCVGGLGRTGTVLACMAVLAGVPAASAVDWVRREYRPAGVETSAQEQWVRWFAGRMERDG